MLFIYILLNIHFCMRRIVPWTPLPNQLNLNYEGTQEWLAHISMNKMAVSILSQINPTPQVHHGLRAA